MTAIISRARRYVLLFGLTVGVTVAEAQAPEFRSSTDTVRVYVTVTDQRGRLVTDLSKDAFAVRDNGVEQPVTQFDDTPVPIRLVVLFDVSDSMARNLPMMREGAQRFLAGMHADDLITIGTFGASEVRLSSSYTRDLNELKRMLPDKAISGQGSPVWRALLAAVDALKGYVGERRSVILLVSDGLNGDPVLQNSLTETDVIKAAQNAGVMIYCIGMTPFLPLSAEPKPYSGLADIASETGGGYLTIRAATNLQAGVALFGDVAVELHSQYLLGFEPPRRDGKVHRIDVRVTQSGMKARARRNYLAPN